MCDLRLFDWSRKLVKPLNPVNQSHSKLKPITTSDLITCAFPRFRQFAWFSLSSHWLLVIGPFLRISVMNTLVLVLKYSIEIMPGIHSSSSRNFTRTGSIKILDSLAFKMCHVGKTFLLKVLGFCIITKSHLHYQKIAPTLILKKKLK